MVGKTVIVNRNYVHAIGGRNSVESFDKTRSRWIVHKYKTKRRRQFSAVVNIQTDTVTC